VTRLQSGHLGMCIRGPSVLYPKQSLKQSLAAQPPGAPQISEFTVMGYPPLLLSDKVSTSYLLPLLALWLLMPQSICLLSCIGQVQQGHRLHLPAKRLLSRRPLMVARKNCKNKKRAIFCSQFCSIFKT